MPKDAVVSAAESQPGEGVTSTAYTDLTDAEQSIARTAAEDGIYHACPELPDEVRSFSSRFDGPDGAYLRYDGTTYALWIRIEDTVRAGTADPPAETPSCGFI